MNMEKINVLFTYIGIVLIIVLLSSATYAFLGTEVKKIPEDKVYLDDNIKVNFDDTSNVSMVNFKPLEKIVKVFTVTNTSDTIKYYDIILNDVINNFSLKSDLVYSLESENGAYVFTHVAPSEDSNIASNIKIDKNEEHKYTFTITFKENEENQTINLNKTFSSNIKIISTDDAVSYKKGSLGYEIVNNIISSFKNNEDIEKEGIYYTNNSINGKTVYFYRGSNDLNNNVVFGKNCYKIIRTTEDGGIRIIYNGPFQDGKCTNNINTLEDLTEFNLKNNYNAYVGYMYGNPSSNNYESEHKNLNSSSVKIVLDSWYTANISEFNEFISQNTIYCNNRNLSKFTLNNILYDNLGYGNNISGYKAMKDYIDNNFSYDCTSLNDRFCVNSKYGNNVLTNSIGLITLEELYYAGYENSKNNVNNYLYSKVPYWTMTSAYFDGTSAYNFIVNKDKISIFDVSVKAGIRPVITLNKDTIILSGDGRLDNPYMLFRRIL